MEVKSFYPQADVTVDSEIDKIGDAEIDGVVLE
jgi:hypothetical protein